MQLNVLDRVALLSILPKEGDITSLRLVRETREDLSFSDAERKELHFIKLPNGRMGWEPNGELTKEVKLGDTIIGMIVVALKDLNEKKKLQEEHLDLYERFVEGKEEK